MRDRFGGQPWRQIIGMCNLAARRYADLDPRRAWRTATSVIPALRAYLHDVVLAALT